MAKHSTSEPAHWAPTHQAAPAPVRRPAGTSRFSARFITLATRVLLTLMAVSVAAGFILGPLSDTVDGEAGDTLGVIAAALVIGGILVPLLLAAILGGEAIRAGAGIIGFFLIVGMTSAIAGSTELGYELLGPVRTPWAFWGGVALMALSVLAFWIVGWIARVPMWIQAPFIGSPRVVVRGSSDSPTDVVLTNDLDKRGP